MMLLPPLAIAEELMDYEEWLPAAFCIGEPWRSTFEVSSWGHVRRIGGEVPRLKTYIHASSNGSAYRRINLRVAKSAAKRMRMARLVLLTFVGEPENITDEADHIDHNTLNDRIENLRWVTGEENLQHRRAYGQKRDAKPQANC